MRIDVCDLAGGCPCALKRALHGQQRSAAVLRRLRDVMCVCGAAIPAKLQQQELLLKSICQVGGHASKSPALQPCCHLCGLTAGHANKRCMGGKAPA